VTPVAVVPSPNFHSKLVSVRPGVPGLDPSAVKLIVCRIPGDVGEKVNATVGPVPWVTTTLVVTVPVAPAASVTDSLTG
jgi:hypothetical protein